MPARNAPNSPFEIAHLIRMERLTFAAKVRLARAVAGLSQSELAACVGMTQRSIHKLEQGGTEPRRATIAALAMLWREQGIEFEDMADGGFRAVIRSGALEPVPPAAGRRPRNRIRPARMRAPAAGYRA